MYTQSGAAHPTRCSTGKAAISISEGCVGCLRQGWNRPFSRHTATQVVEARKQSGFTTTAGVPTVFGSRPRSGTADIGTTHRRLRTPLLVAEEVRCQPPTVAGQENKLDRGA